jgi:hypothetical protein
MTQLSNNIKSYNLECSPSYIINNLSQSKDSLYFIHNSQSFPRVLVIKKSSLNDKNNPTKNISILNSSEKNEMLFIKSLYIKNEEYIAVGLYNGFKLWNKEGNRLLYQISNPNSNKNKIYAFISCGEFALDKEKYNLCADSILSGDNYGNLFLIFGSKTNWKGAKIFSTEKSESIISIGSNIYINDIGITLDNGEVIILKIEKNECSLIKKFEENGKKLISVNSVIFSKKDKSEFFLGCGFINGEIRIYSLKEYNWKFSINSNLRSIGPMIVRYDNEIIVGSDDGQINVWKYEDSKDKIILKKNLLFEDKMIVGLAYDSNEEILYFNSYDYPEIMTVTDI